MTPTDTPSDNPTTKSRTLDETLTLLLYKDKEAHDMARKIAKTLAPLAPDVQKVVLDILVRAHNVANPPKPTTIQLPTVK